MTGIRTRETYVRDLKSRPFIRVGQNNQKTAREPCKKKNNKVDYSTSLLIYMTISLSTFIYNI